MISLFPYIEIHSKIYRTLLKRLKFLVTQLLYSIGHEVDSLFSAILGTILHKIYQLVELKLRFKY